MIRKTPLRRTPLRSKANKSPKPSGLGDTSVSTKGIKSLTGAENKPNISLIKLYEEIWMERDHVSFISGERIPFPEPSNFMHVLAKGQNKYPKFKFYKKNIVLGLPYEHFLYDDGHQGLRDAYAKKYPGCWDNLGTLKLELLEEYSTVSQA